MTPGSFGSTALILAVLVITTWILWARRARGWALATGLCALAPTKTLAQELPWPVYLAAAMVAVLFAWHRWGRSAGLVRRWSTSSRRKSGVASTLDIVRHASVSALRRRLDAVRPSLAELGWWVQWRVPAVEYGVQLVRSGAVGVWSSIEDVVLIFGGPRTGKTGWLAGRILDFPGAAVVTSTRTDLYQLCAPLRARTRGPVFVFNAVGLAGIDSTITFDPLTGCSNPVTAGERATDMIAATSRAGGGDREFWEAQARRVLAALLHAAALGGHTMADVLGWVADPELAANEVPALLRRSGVAAFEQDVVQFLGTNPRTQTSITSTVMPALGWLTHPAAAAAAAPGVGFDVAELLRSKATVFLLGAEETQSAPLVCALTGHIAREARRLAALHPSGRLDPPLGLFLDEAALVSPVPLESWTADMGGRGVTIVCAFQSRAQLLARWGQHNTATILNNTGSVLIFGGTRDRDDLLFWSTLTGERDESVVTTDMHGQLSSRSIRRVAVLQPSQIANLPAGRVLLIRRGIPPVLGRAQMAWQRRDVRDHQRGIVRIDRRILRLNRAERRRRWRDLWLERLLTALARRWPARFGAAAMRVRDANNTRYRRRTRVVATATVMPRTAIAAGPGWLHPPTDNGTGDGPNGGPGDSSGGDGRWTP